MAATPIRQFETKEWVIPLKTQSGKSITWDGSVSASAAGNTCVCSAKVDGTNILVAVTGAVVNGQQDNVFVEIWDELPPGSGNKFNKQSVAIPVIVGPSDPMLPLVATPVA